VPAKAQSVLSDLIKKQAFQPEEIAILVFDAQSVRALKSSPLLKQFSITDTIQSGSICCTTIRKFKGLEAKVIILLDASPKRLQSDDGTIAFYVGASRAMQQLHIFFTATDDELPDFMSWACNKHDRLLKKSNKGLEKLFHATIQT
jgi:superfamily I DNA/RNA helicase